MKKSFRQKRTLEGIAFSLSKGCYPGQEVVARMDTYGSVKRRMVGLVLEAEIPQLPEPGAKLFSGTREVGWVSSSTHSPLIKKPIALGFPLRDFTQPQTKLEIEIQRPALPGLCLCLAVYRPLNQLRDSRTILPNPESAIRLFLGVGHERFFPQKTIPLDVVRR